MKKTMMLMSALFLLSGCTTTSAPISEYRLLSKKSETAFEAKGCIEKSIKVALSFAANSLMAQKMKYAKEDFAEYAFSESQWAQSPNQAITQEILESVRGSNLFSSVQNYKSRSMSDYILESSIEEFAQHFDTKEKSSYALMRISFALVDVKSSRVLGSVTLSKREDVKELNARGGVESLSNALTQILQEKNIWLNEACK